MHRNPSFYVERAENSKYITGDLAKEENTSHINNVDVAPVCIPTFVQSYIRIVW